MKREKRLKKRTNAQFSTDSNLNFHQPHPQFLLVAHILRETIGSCAHKHNNYTLLIWKVKTKVNPNPGILRKQCLGNFLNPVSHTTLVHIQEKPKENEKKGRKKKAQISFNIYII